MSAISIREAILKAADWIQQHPKDFQFSSCDIPSCGTPGCAIGWIVAFSGFKPGKEWNAGLAEKALGIFNNGDADEEFYNRMDKINERWLYHPSECAETMRLYADKYHPSIERKPGAEVCREIMARPYQEREHA